MTTHTGGYYTSYDCTASREHVQTCSKCGNTITTTISPSSGHNFSFQQPDSVAATCTTAGYTNWECSNTACSAMSKKVIPALGHDPQEVNIAATCTTAGQKGSACSRCDYSDIEEIPALGHDWPDTGTVTTQPTCTTSGKTTYKCTRCTATNTTSVPGPLGHDMQEVNIAATCTTAGQKGSACSRCDYSDIEVLPATGHSMGGWVQVTPSTCTSQGTERRDCSKCDYYEEQSLPLLSHTYTDTCRCGVTSVKCIRCTATTFHIAPTPTDTSSQSRTYDGSTYTVISTGSYYNLSGTYSTPNAGNHTATVTIDNSSVHKFSGNVSSYSINWTINPKKIYAEWEDKDKFVYNGRPQSPSATAETGVAGETAILTTTKQTNPNTTSTPYYISTASISSVTGGNGKASNYSLANETKEYRIYRAPTVPPTITFKDPDGKVIDREWYNKDLTIEVSGSSLEGTIGEVGYKYRFDSDAYAYYTGPIPYKNIATDNTIYFKSYNKDLEDAESEETSKKVTKIEKEIPQMSISSNQNWEKSQTAIVTFKDTGGSHLLAKTYTLKYSWTQTKDTPSKYDDEITVQIPEGVDEKIEQIPKNTDTGVWYLHVKLTEGLEDNATNVLEDTQMYGEFWLDNEAPIITLENNHELQVVDKTDLYTLYFEVKDNHAGIEIDEFTKEDIEILLQPSNTESAAIKSLTPESTRTVDGVDVHLYKLELTNVAETGYYRIRIKADKIKDKAGNGNEETIFTGEQIGLAGDNEKPTVAISGPITVKSITDGCNLSNVIDDRYINKEYEITIPVKVEDVGILDITNGLQATDFSVLVGGSVVNPVVTVTCDKMMESLSFISRVKTMEQEYTVTISGLLLDGYLSLELNEGAILDDTENASEATVLNPYSIKDGTTYFTYVDNTTPKISMLDADKKIIANKNTEITFKLKVTDAGAGIREDEFVASDILVQLDGSDVLATTKELTPDRANDYNSVLGSSVSTNYTYRVTVSGIVKEGTLRLAVPGGNVIDKANNASEPVTLEANVVIDNTGPTLGRITTNADINDKVYAEDVIIKIEECHDDSGIASYVWERRKDGSRDWELIKEDNTSSSSSSIQDVPPADGKYYYRVTVTDTVGNSSESEEIPIYYEHALSSRPIIRLEQEVTGTGEVTIYATVTSTVDIDKISVNGYVISKGNFDVKEMNYTKITRVSYPVTSNGVYTFIATDILGNEARESINVNLVDGTKPVITYEVKDATIYEGAQIIFKANEPVRIVNPSGYSGITFDTSNFSTIIIATVYKGLSFEDGKIFIFENKAMLKEEVEVVIAPITSVQYLRFDNESAGLLGITPSKANRLTQGMNESKTIIDSKIVSYYGFGNEKVSTKISNSNELDVAINLGGASLIQTMDESGKLVEIEQTSESTPDTSGSYVNGNKSGMYGISASTMQPGESDLEDNTSTYSAFRVTIKVK